MIIINPAYEWLSLPIRSKFQGVPKMFLLRLLKSF